jgi:hypothetical protein
MRIQSRDGQHGRFFSMNFKTKDSGPVSDPCRQISCLLCWRCLLNL